MNSARLCSLIIGLTIFCSWSPASRALAKGDQHDNNVILVPNRGQVIDMDGKLRPDIAVVSENGPVRLFFSPGGISYVYAQHDPLKDNERAQLARDGIAPAFKQRLYRMDLEIVGANKGLHFELAEDAGAGYFNYYLGHCPEGVTGVRPLRELRYRNVYERIDLVVRPQGDGIKYDFIVHPGGDPDDIMLRYRGATSLTPGLMGSVMVDNPLGRLEESAPYVYQEPAPLASLAQQPVAASFRIEGATLRFELGDYDRSRSLIIDPGVVWASYYGAQGHDSGRDIKVDNNGDLLITGETGSMLFPVQPGQFQDVIGGKRDAFVLKFDKNRERVWTTFFGGSENDAGNGIHVDRTRAVSIVGSTFSKNMPLKGNSIQTTILNLDPVAFVAKFNRDGSLLWSTFFGGGEPDVGVAIAGDARGNIAITGHTREQGANFPLQGAWQTENKNRKQSIFIALLTSSGQLLWSTYFGGSENEIASAIAIDKAGDVIVTGTSISEDFPTWPGAYRETRPGAQGSVIIKMSPTGNRRWATFYGGSGHDVANAVAVDSSGNILIGGGALSEDLPLKDALQTQHANAPNPLIRDAFLALFDAQGRFQWGTYLGAECDDVFDEVAFYPDGGMAVAGRTRSINIPVTDDADQPLHSFGTDDTKCIPPPESAGPSFDLMYGKIPPGTPRAFSYLSYYGGAFGDHPFGIGTIGETTEDGNIVITGMTSSFDLKVVKPFQKTKSLVEEVFLFEYGCNPGTDITVIGELEFCEGGSVELDAGDGFAQYEWSDGQTTQRISVEESGDYFVTVTDELGCVFSTEPVNVKVWPIPEPIITADGPTVLCDGGTVTLDAGPGFATYKWSNDEETQKITVSSEGVYFVTVANEGGCEAETSINVVVRKKPEPSSDPLALDFGELDGCKTSETIDLTFNNPEGFPILIESITFDDPAYSFTAPTLDAEVPAGGSIPITVLFSPGPDTPPQAQMTIAGSPCEWTYQLDVRGSKGEIVFSADPVSANFGTVLLCDPTPRDTTIELFNNGTSDIIVSEPSIGAPFTLLDPEDWPQTVAPGATLALRISYEPQQSGNSALELRVPFVAGDCDETLRIGFSGLAADAELQTVAKVDFGNLNGCEANSDREIVLRNDSDLPLQLLEVLDAAGDVSLLDDVPLTVDANGNRTIRLRFAPQTNDVLIGSLVLRYALGPCEKEITLSYEGSKEGTDFTVPPSLDFATLVTCNEETGSLEVRVESQAGGTIKSVTTSGPFSSSFTEGDAVPADFTISFEPQSDGDASGSIELVFEPCDIVRTIELSGRRETHTLEGPSARDFGIAALGGAVQEELRYRNTGSGNFSIDALDCIAAPFRVLSPAASELPIDLEPGEELIITVEFQPTEAGDASGQLCVRNNAPCAVAVETALTARGSDPRGSATILLPDLSAHPDARSFRIPLIAENVDLPDPQAEYALTAYLRYNATMFFPNSLSAGTLAGNSIFQGERLLVLNLDNVSLAEGAVLTEIVGDVLLGNEASSVLHLDSVIWTKGNIEAAVESGSLTLDELCEAAGTRLLDYDEEFGIALMMPNPSGGQVEIAVRGIAGETSVLSIFSLSGQEVYRAEWITPGGHAGRTAQIVSPDVDLVAGYYQVVLKSSVWSDTRSLLVIK